MFGHTSILADPQGTFPPWSLSPLSGTLFFVVLSCCCSASFPSSLLLHSSLSHRLLCPSHLLLPFYLKIICFLVIFLYCLLFHTECSHSYSPWVIMMLMHSTYLENICLTSEWNLHMRWGSVPICFVLPGRTSVCSDNDRQTWYQLIHVTQQALLQVPFQD